MKPSRCAQGALEPFVSVGALLFVLLSGLGCADREFVNPVDTSVALDAPQAVTVATVADTAMTVTWTYSGKTVSGFEIERQSGNGNVSVASVGGSVRSYTHLLPLLTGQTYVYRVRSANSDNRSAYSTSNQIFMTFAAPTNLVASARADTAVQVVWAYTSTFQTGFEIERQASSGGFTAVGSVGAGARQYMDQVALLAGQSYTYRVRAITKNNQTAYVMSSPIIITFTAPNSVSVAAQADTAVSVAWTYTGALQTGFEIERQVGTGSFTTLWRVGAVVRQYVDQVALVVGQSYTYRVRAVTSNNQSAYATSNPVSVSLATPTNVTVSVQIDSAVVVAWAHTGELQTGFEIERQVGTGGFLTVETVGATTRQFVDRLALSDGQAYAYRLRAISKNNRSSYSSGPVFAASLAAPTNLEIASFTNTELTLQWQDNSNIERGFRIEQSSDGNIYAIVATSGSNTSSANISGDFTSGTSFYFRVRPYAVSGDGHNSSPIQKMAPPLGMVFVQGGAFQMGSGLPGEESYQPVHSVTLGSFYIDTYEVTVAQYRAFCTATHRIFPGGSSSNDTDPMAYVSWNDAAAYASWAGKRLPTESEWEYAARGGNKSKGYIYSGSNDPSVVSWYYNNSSYQAHPVGTKLPNELGIYDMSGNVWEWVNDWHGVYTAGAVTNPQGPASGTLRVLRGGSFRLFLAGFCRVVIRDGHEPTYSDYDIGFRCARDF
jgi:formylglycine-generating enzyme